MSGSLHVIIGSMFSGKSTEVIRLINRYKKIYKDQVLLINHQFDTRYGESVISSHDKLQINCMSLDKLSCVFDLEDFNKAKVIFVEEGQFFKDLYDFVTKCADNYNKIIIVSGLDGDYQRAPFGDMLRIIPHAETIKKLNALCEVCGDGTLAGFTQRLVCNKEKEFIGVKEYRAVCRKHYLNK